MIRSSQGFASISRIGQPSIFNADCAVSSQDLAPASFAEASLIPQTSIVLQQVSDRLRAFGGMPHTPDDWQHLVPADLLTQVLKTQVLDHYNQVSIDGCRRISQLQRGHETSEEFHNRQLALREQAQEEVRNAITNEAVIAGIIKELIDNGRVSALNSIFYSKFDQNSRQAFISALLSIDEDFTDPYLTFDPNKDVKDVTLSPLGTVQLYRQYFFELDTFLGTPTGHVWISPGSTVELIEVSTRKTITEKTVEIATETVKKTETSTTDQDELSEAVKQDNWMT